jgi:hypothetical protein
MQIMKDLSLLQLQMRKEEGQALGYVVSVLYCMIFIMHVCVFFSLLHCVTMTSFSHAHFAHWSYSHMCVSWHVQDTRRKILMAKAGMRINWISLAVAYHVAGNHKQCLEIFNTWDKAMAV